jgi:hypothetical protein
VAAVLLLSVVLVVYFGPEFEFNSWWTIAAVLLMFAAGPFAGWLLAIMGGAVLTALWSLVPLTFLSIWPAVRAVRIKKAAYRRFMLALAGALWLFSSTFYLVLMWI